VAGLSGCRGSDRELLQQLLQKYRLHCIALTRGAAGALVMSRDSISDLPGKKVEVVDTVGAGDAFTASLTLDLLAGQDLATANQNAIATASYVCSQPGATMPLPRWAGPMGDASR
jgi:fructokinase